MKTTYNFMLLAIVYFVLSFFLPNIGHSRQLILEKSSIYNNIFVYQDGPYRYLTFGHNRRLYTESVFDIRDELSLPVTYTRVMTVGLAYAERIQQITEIGSGGARTSWYLHKHFPKIRIKTVELDPDVVSAAEQYFGVQRKSGKFDISIDDGRRFLMKNSTLSNIILVDAYRGPFVPFHLLTKEFYQLVKRRLAPGGVVVQNVEPTTMVYEAAVSTLISEFDNVDIFDADGNVVVIAYDGKRLPNEVLNKRARSIDNSAQLKYPILSILSGRQSITTKPNATALTDDFAPVEALRNIDRHNRKWNEFE